MEEYGHLLLKMLNENGGDTVLRNAENVAMEGSLQFNMGDPLSKAGVQKVERLDWFV